MSLYSLTGVFPARLRNGLTMDAVMRISKFFMIAALLVTVAACDKKVEVTEAAPAGKVEAQQALPAVQPKHDLPSSEQPKHADESPGKKAGNEVNGGEHKPVAKPESAEQVLESVIPNRQEPEDARVAEQKRRGKKAEDEMLQEIDKYK